MEKKNIKSNKDTDLAKEKASQNPDAAIMASGVGNIPLAEKLPKFNKALAEKCVEGQNNNCIVFGRDRPGHEGSGYGGLGDTEAGSIDIVVGRSGKEGEFVNPDFVNDAARIHISQKTDVDTNFKIADGTNFSTSESAIGIKADAVRVAARRSVKVVAGSGTDAQNYGVDIIANNDDRDLQPLVKGKNLEQAFDEMVEIHNKFVDIVQAYARSQDVWNGILTILLQHSPFYGALTVPQQTHFEEGIKNIQKHAEQFHKAVLVDHKISMAKFKDTYLKPNSAFYINSKNNKVN